MNILKKGPGLTERYDKQTDRQTNRQMTAFTLLIFKAFEI
jgi:hypothetical protein